MPSFNQTQLSYKVQNANSVVVMIGNVPVAFAQTSTQTVDFGTESLYGIGTAKPQEIQQLKFAPTISVDAFALTNQGLQFLSFPTSLLVVLANNSFDMHVMASDGTVLLTYVACVATNFNQNEPVNAIITQTITFQALDVLDSVGQSILNGNFALQNVATLAAEGVALNTLGL
jgi:hypothetical protein